MHCGSSSLSRTAGFAWLRRLHRKMPSCFWNGSGLDTFAAEQRLDYGFVHDGMTLEELFDADISGRDFPAGNPTR